MYTQPMYMLTNIECDMIRSRANMLAVYWIDYLFEYKTILKELNTLPSCYLILHIYWEALDLFMNYLYSCDDESLERFGIYRTSPDQFEDIMRKMEEGARMIRKRIHTCMK